ncbi:MAG TPA: hypothetical protein VN797_02750 [Gemmatimonadaceae bacterium]|nr:hypothetical protein [Gemmatimonadaceae bacterium]
MRKTIGAVITPSEKSHRSWLDIEQLVHVEVSSEEAAHPIERALRVDDTGGWRASERGTQVIRLRFDTPRRVQLIRLVFDAAEASRVQEFVLRWQASDDPTWRDIVRQQYTFSQPATTREIEEYVVALGDVRALELEIAPDIGSGDAHATLSEWRLA